MLPFCCRWSCVRKSDLPESPSVSVAPVCHLCINAIGHGVSASVASLCHHRRSIQPKECRCDALHIDLRPGWLATSQQMIMWNVLIFSFLAFLYQRIIVVVVAVAVGLFVLAHAFVMRCQADKLYERAFFFFFFWLCSNEYQTRFCCWIVAVDLPGSRQWFPGTIDVLFLIVWPESTAPEWGLFWIVSSKQKNARCCTEPMFGCGSTGRPGIDLRAFPCFYLSVLRWIFGHWHWSHGGMRASVAMHRNGITRTLTGSNVSTLADLFIRTGTINEICGCVWLHYVRSQHNQQ